MKKIYFLAALIANILSAQSISLVKDINAGALASTPKYIVEYNDKLYFSATTATEGNEVWESDGTEEGTKIVEDLNAGTASFLPSNMTVFNDKLYVSNLIGNGSALPIGYYSYNGTSFSLVNGTIQYPNYITSTDDNLYFIKSSNLYSLDKDENLTNITNGNYTSNGSYAIMEDKVILSLEPVADTSTRTQLYSYSEQDGFKLLKNIGIYANPQSLYYSSSLNKVFFTAYTSDSGSELWVTDGTEEGTKLFKDLIPGSNSSYPTSFKQIGDKVFFTAYTDTNGNELWVTDGTEDGTKMVKDIYEGSTTSNPQYFTELNGKLYFIADDGSKEAKLWESDGTEEGTKITLALNPGYTNAVVGQLYAYKNSIFASAKLSVSKGQELYKIDLESLQVSDITPTKKIAVYPNPTRNQVFFDNITSGSYKLYDLTGALVNQGEIKNNASLTMPSKSGIYLIQIFSKEGKLVLNTKIIKN